MISVQVSQYIKLGETSGGEARSSKFMDMECPSLKRGYPCQDLLLGLKRLKSYIK